MILQTQITTTIPQTDIISINEQFIDAVSQSSSEINEFLFMDIQITTIKFLDKHVIQINPSKFEERLFSDIYLGERENYKAKW